MLELENEIDTFKKETDKVKNLQRTIEKEREVFKQKSQEFEKEKEDEQKKMADEIRRLKQDKVLLEKLKRESESKNKGRYDLLCNSFA